MRPIGFEPITQRWQRYVLPLKLWPHNVVNGSGIEPLSTELQPVANPSQLTVRICLATGAGFEPARERKLHQVNSLPQSASMRTRHNF